ncbi:MAG TPA: glycosyl hydrolase 108 family protein, partial [Sphingomicrobium sp.]|nr:glycosyl hydrolase 108 family protein [Sphingomicrobium sp.]
MESRSLDDLVDALIEREGGYVNHPADRGGPTCWGIT